MRIPIPILLLAILLPIVSSAQEKGTDTACRNISDKAFNAIGDKYSKLNDAVYKQTAKLLDRMQRREARLEKKLQGIDSSKAADLFANAQARYQHLQAHLQTPLNPGVTNPLKEYLPGVDSMQTAFRFLSMTGLSQDNLQKIQTINAQIQQLQGTLQKANDVQVFLKEREQQLQDGLAQYNWGGQLLGMNKQLYYYHQQIAQYKALLHDPQKLEEKILSTIRELPAFQRFFQQNSYLSQLFGVPANYGSAASVAGLQTRAQVQQLIGQRISTQSLPGMPAGNNAQSFMQQQMQGVQGQLSNMQTNVGNLGGGGNNSDMVMPTFKPNTEKTKAFFKRLEYGFNMQTTQATTLAPSIGDLGLIVGYKFSDRATAGVGLSYKLGFGRPINHIKFSNEGVGFRSYIDIKAKGSFWVTGGMEYNYLQTFSKLSDLNKNITAWQKSALLGLTKKYKINKNKQGSLQLLYDFLHNQHVPVSQALIFRLGYSL